MICMCTAVIPILPIDLFLKSEVIAQVFEPLVLRLSNSRVKVGVGRTFCDA